MKNLEKKETLGKFVRPSNLFWCMGFVFVFVLGLCVYVYV